MCCIFTCCGWMLDLIQRCWVFFMSCCISSAVCCVLLTASTSGIALGYNYSLAEYIDLKDTNISVYIKRGVFDDEIANDMEWRRAGHKPDISGFISDKNLRTAAPDNENETLKPSRRLDDSIYESDSQNKYEGSLMRLTARAPYQHNVNNVPVEPSSPFQPYTSPTTPVESITSLENINKMISHFPPGSLDQLKAIQYIINARRAGQQRSPQPPQQEDARRSDGFKTKVTKYDDTIDALALALPNFPDSIASGRRRIEGKIPSNIFREAVPRGDLAGWPKNAVPIDPNPDYEVGRPPTFPPHPPTWSSSPRRPSKFGTPTRLTSAKEQRGPSRTPQGRLTPGAVREGFKDDLDKYKQRLLINQYDEANAKDEQKKKPDDQEYDDEFKGAPVRRKRGITNTLQKRTYEAEVNNENLIISTSSFGFEVTQATSTPKSLTDMPENKERPVHTAKQLSNSTRKTKRIHSTNSTKNKRKNRRKKPRKHKKPEPSNKKRRRQEQQTFLMRQNAKGFQKKIKPRTFEYLKQNSPLKCVADINATSVKHENIVEPIDGASNFMNKLLTFFFSINQTDGQSKNKTNTIPHAEETTPITVN